MKWHIFKNEAWMPTAPWIAIYGQSGGGLMRDNGFFSTWQEAMDYANGGWKR